MHASRLSVLSQAAKKAYYRRLERVKGLQDDNQMLLEKLNMAESRIRSMEASITRCGELSLQRV